MEATQKTRTDMLSRFVRVDRRMKELRARADGRSRKTERLNTVIDMLTAQRSQAAQKLDRISAAPEDRHAGLQMELTRQMDDIDRALRKALDFFP